MLACFVVMVNYRLTGFRSLHRFLQNHPTLAQACGLPAGHVPSDRTFSRRFQQLDGVLLQATAQLLRQLTSRKVLRWALTVIDGTALVAKGRRPKGKVPDKRTTDKQAAWGFSTSKDWFWGYKLHVLVAVRRVILPVAWTVTQANRQEVTQLLPVVRQARTVCGRRKRRMREVAGDMGYDSTAHYRQLAAWTIRLTTPINRRRGGPLSRLQQHRQQYARTPCGRGVLKRRADVERFFSQPKGIFLFDPLPIAGRTKVATYVSLVLVSYLIGVAYNGLAHRPPRALKSLVA
jgi:transposase